MAIVGVVLAMGTQIWEWRKSIKEDLEARQRNQALLYKIKRAVNRFQDKDVFFDWSFSFDSSDEVFGPYIRDLAKLVEDAPFKPPFKISDWFAAARDRGPHVIGHHPKFGVSHLSIEADSRGLCLIRLGRVA